MYVIYRTKKCALILTVFQSSVFVSVETLTSSFIWRIGLFHITIGFWVPVKSRKIQFQHMSDEVMYVGSVVYEYTNKKQLIMT